MTPATVRRRAEEWRIDGKPNPAPTSPVLWVPGDWNAFFGLVHQRPAQRHRADGPGPVRVIKLPDDIVFGRILPALGIALPLGNLWYAYLA